MRRTKDEKIKALKGVTLDLVRHLEENFKDKDSVWVLNARAEISEAETTGVKKFKIGKKTEERVFKAAELTNLSDLQAVLDAVESALSTDAEPVEPFGWTSKHVNDGEQHRLWGRNKCNVLDHPGQVVQALYTAPPAPSVAVNLLKDAIRAVSSAFDPSSMHTITESQAQGRAIRILNKFAALSAQVQEITRCRDCDGYNCDDGCAFPEAEGKINAN